MFQTTNLHLIWNQRTQQQREAARTVVVFVAVQHLARNSLFLPADWMSELSARAGPSHNSLNQNSPSVLH